MTDPGETVADEQDEQEVAEREGDEDGPQQLQDSKRGSNEVESSAGAVGVLRQVEGIEVVKVLVLGLHQQNIIKLARRYSPK